MQGWNIDAIFRRICGNHKIILESKGCLFHLKMHQAWDRYTGQQNIWFDAKAKTSAMHHIGILIFKKFNLHQVIALWPHESFVFHSTTAPSPDFGTRPLHSNLTCNLSLLSAQDKGWYHNVNWTESKGRALVALSDHCHQWKWIRTHIRIFGEFIWSSWQWTHCQQWSSQCCLDSSQEAWGSRRQTFVGVHTRQNNNSVSVFGNVDTKKHPHLRMTEFDRCWSTLNWLMKQKASVSGEEDKKTLN